MQLGDEEFEKIARNMAKANNVRFNVIRLRCRRCNELAFAKSVPLAKAFGWIRVVKKGSEYEGLCMTCARQHRRSGRER